MDGGRKLGGKGNEDGNQVWGDRAGEGWERGQKAEEGHLRQTGPGMGEAPGSLWGDPSRDS